VHLAFGEERLSRAANWSPEERLARHAVVECQGARLRRLRQELLLEGRALVGARRLSEESVEAANTIRELVVHGELQVALARTATIMEEWKRELERLVARPGLL